MPNLCVPLRIYQMHLDSAVLTLAESDVSRSFNYSGINQLVRSRLDTVPLKEIFHGTIPQEDCASRSAQRRGRGEDCSQRRG